MVFVAYFLAHASEFVLCPACSPFKELPFLPKAVISFLAIYPFPAAPPTQNQDTSTLQRTTVFGLLPTQQSQFCFFLNVSSVPNVRPELLASSRSRSRVSCSYQLSQPGVLKQESSLKKKRKKSPISGAPG